MTAELVKLIEKLDLLPQSLHCKRALSFSQAVQTKMRFFLKEERAFFQVCKENNSQQE